MQHFYFIDNEIYFKNEKLPPRKVELFNVKIGENTFTGYDKDANLYKLDIKDLIIEEE